MTQHEHTQQESYLVPIEMRKNNSSTPTSAKCSQDTNTNLEKAHIVVSWSGKAVLYIPNQESTKML